MILLFDKTIMSTDSVLATLFADDTNDVTLLLGVIPDVITLYLKEIVIRYNAC